MSDAMNFDHLVELCRLTHEEMQKQAVRAVDLTLVVRNWLFGRYIVEYEQNGADRAAYGAGLMDALTSRLKPFGIKGVSATRLRLYRSFYREYGGIQPTPSAELAPAPATAAELVKSVETLIRRFHVGWSHYVSLLTIDSPYLAWQFQRHEVQTWLLQHATGTTMASLNQSILSRVQIPYAPLPEQTAIAAVITDMDATLSALEQRRVKTRALKQGMMQELLTGRTRLTPTT